MTPLNYVCPGCGGGCMDHLNFRRHLFMCNEWRRQSADHQFMSDAVRGVQKVLEIWKADQHPVMSAEVAQLVGEIELGLLGQF